VQPNLPSTSSSGIENKLWDKICNCYHGKDAKKKMGNSNLLCNQNSPAPLHQALKINYGIIFAIAAMAKMQRKKMGSSNLGLCA